MAPTTVPPMAPLTLTTNIPFAGSAISRQARRLYIGNIPFGVTEVSSGYAVQVHCYVQSFGAKVAIHSENLVSASSKDLLGSAGTV